MKCQKIIVDCDAGSDDALALALLIAAHKQKRVEILGITCVYGNTNVDNVINNVFRTLCACNATDIPVFKGANSALLQAENVQVALDHSFHGSDGFGDVFHDKPDISNLKKEHAVCALRRIASTYPEEVSILCIAPLTNIALAIKMYPDFAAIIKNFYIMGGNLSAIGNCTSQAEFNFYADPESVHIVMCNAGKKLWILPWETCLKSKITHDWRSNVFGKIDSPVVKFLNAIEDAIYSNDEKLKDNIYIPCDAFVAAVMLKPDVAKEVALHHVDIELHGKRTRGQVVIDHLKSNEPNANVIVDLDYEIFKDLLLFSANSNKKNSHVVSQE